MNTIPTDDILIFIVVWLFSVNDSRPLLLTQPNWNSSPYTQDKKIPFQRKKNRSLVLVSKNSGPLSCILLDTRAHHPMIWSCLRQTAPPKLGCWWKHSEFRNTADRPTTARVIIGCWSPHCATIKACRSTALRMIKCCLPPFSEPYLLYCLQLCCPLYITISDSKTQRTEQKNHHHG